MLRAFGHRVAKCCNMLGVVGSSLKMVKFEPTRPNVLQHVATRWPNARNMLCPTMLQYVAKKFPVPLDGWRRLCHDSAAAKLEPLIIGYGSRRSRNGKQELENQRFSGSMNLGRKRMGRRAIDGLHEAMLAGLDHFGEIYGALSTDC